MSYVRSGRFQKRDILATEKLLISGAPNSIITRILSGLAKYDPIPVSLDFLPSITKWRKPGI
jgi:hypothetical protein